MTFQDTSLPDASTNKRDRPGGRKISVRRIFVGGSAFDRSRLPRYVWIALLALSGIWAPITGYLKSAPPSFTSHMSLILPGSGASASVNLNEIGQASSYANSAFSSNSISPTETYKRLLSADRVVRDAADRLGMKAKDFGKPQIQLVDQTAFIHVKLAGPSAEAAQIRNRALMQAFFAEIDRLRSDEMDSRETGGESAILDYQSSVAATREEIALLQEETGLRSVDQFNRQVDEVDALQAEIDTLLAEYRRKVAAVRGLEIKLGTDAELAAKILRLSSDNAYIALLESMALASTELATARARYGDRHPEVIKAASVRDAAQAKAEARAAALVGQTMTLERIADGGRGALLTELVRHETERAGLEAELAERRTLLDEQSRRLDRLAPLAARLEDLQRDFTVAEAVFASAIARTQSSKSDIYASYPLVQVLEDPTLPERPSSPNKKLAIAAGIAASILLVFALSLAWIRRALIEKLIIGAKTKS